MERDMRWTKIDLDSVKTQVRSYQQGAERCGAQHLEGNESPMRLMGGGVLECMEVHGYNLTSLKTSAYTRPCWWAKKKQLKCFIRVKIVIKGISSPELCDSLRV